MPACKKCGRVAASAEMRRSPTGGWICRTKTNCDLRRKQVNR